MRNVPKRLQFVISFFACAAGFLLTGPASWLGLPDELPVVLAGMVILGTFTPLCFINSLPEATEQIILRYKIVEGTDHVSEGAMHDILGALFMLSNNIANFAFPMLGSAIFDEFALDKNGEHNPGYKAVMNVGFVTLLMTALVYFQFNAGGS